MEDVVSSQFKDVNQAVENMALVLLFCQINSNKRQSKGENVNWQKLEEKIHPRKLCW